jgi:DNA-binding MarR family transcriptional regulator
MGDLAGMLNCDNSNITGLVDRVAGHGLVIRGTHHGDRRVTRVALTQRGAEQVQRFAPSCRAASASASATGPPAAAAGSQSSPPLPPAI